jgi:hypothetical protein
MLFFHQNFTNSNYQFDNFIFLNKNELLDILSWRNAENTRLWMKNSEIIQKNNHLNYCNNLINSENVGHWRLKYQDRFIGVISMNQYYETSNSCEWGFYLNISNNPEDLLTIFYSAQILFFNILKINKLHGTIKINNTIAMLLNDFFNFKEIDVINNNDNIYSLRELKKENSIILTKAMEDLFPIFLKFYITKKNYANKK